MKWKDADFLIYADMHICPPSQIYFTYRDISIKGLTLSHIGSNCCKEMKFPGQRAWLVVVNATTLTLPIWHLQKYYIITPRVFNGTRLRKTNTYTNIHNSIAHYVQKWTSMWSVKCLKTLHKSSLVQYRLMLNIPQVFPEFKKKQARTPVPTSLWVSMRSLWEILWIFLTVKSNTLASIKTGGKSKWLWSSGDVHGTWVPRQVFSFCTIINFVMGNFRTFWCLWTIIHCTLTAGLLAHGWWDLKLSNFFKLGNLSFEGGISWN